VDLNEYEEILLAEVVCPEDIEVGFDGEFFLGGLGGVFWREMEEGRRKEEGERAHLPSSSTSTLTRFDLSRSKSSTDVGGLENIVDSLREVRTP